MFNEIRKIFRQSIDAFRDELGTRDPEDEVSELLTAMRRELVSVRAALPEQEAEIGRVRAELTREREALALCERRARMAGDIGDTETVRVAGEFAVKHRERIAVLEQKAAAAQAELELARRDASEMATRYKEAEANRFALLAQLRRSRAAENLRSASSGDEGAFADFDRMSEKVDREASIVDALDEMDGSEPTSAAPTAKDAVEERLRQLKRKMGRSD